MARILFTTHGSYGDLHPYMAVGLELQRLGHAVTVGTSASYCEKVTAAGLGFRPVRPDISLQDRELMGAVFHARRGSERVIRLVASTARESYEDTLSPARESDLIVTHVITLAAVAIAEKTGTPWVSTTLAPLSYISAYDAPVPPQMPGFEKLRVLGPRIMRALYAPGLYMSRRWLRPVLELRRELGLDNRRHPLFEGLRSPQLDLALFSSHFAEKQPDWPPQTMLTGFPFLDQATAGMPPELADFLDRGSAPVVFTLGSSAVGAAGAFYHESVEAVERLGIRAVLLTGSHPENVPARLPNSVVAISYCPHALLFPRAAVNVHAGGIGTTAEALRAGRPMLVAPLAHDQFDNAARAQRSGVAEVVRHTRYNALSAERALKKLLSGSGYQVAAKGMAANIRAEHGAVRAAAEIHKLLA